MFEAVETLASYWEQRAAKFARHEGGLRAVCSYGMPQFYNRSIEWCQQSALRPWLQNIHDQDVLEIGCGVGRWTERLAQNGNRVCGVDISPTVRRAAYCGCGRFREQAKIRCRTERYRGAAHYG